MTSERAKSMTMRQRVKRLLLALLPAKKITVGTRCTCGALASTVVAVYGLLCDEPGTVRNYTFCDPCTRWMLDNSRGTELVGRLDG